MYMKMSCSNTILHLTFHYFNISVESMHSNYEMTSNSIDMPIITVIEKS